MKILICILSLLLVSCSVGTRLPNTKITNFGRLDNNLYRGSQPSPEDYKYLANLGIQTILDLRNPPLEYSKREAEKAGLTYYNVPLSDTKKPSDASIIAIYCILQYELNKKIFIHCHAGISRTGLIVATREVIYKNWTKEQSWAEAEQYHWRDFWGHKPLKEWFFRDFKVEEFKQKD